jgi:hypothetical protein
VSGLMRDPEQLREDLERMVELERRGAHGNPKREMKAWLDKLAEVDSERRSYIKLAARGTITDLLISAQTSKPQGPVAGCIRG